MKKIIGFLLAAVLMLSCIGCQPQEKKIVVGAKDYTEQDVLGNLLTILIENNSDFIVEYKHEMASNVIFAAVQSGDVDVYVDYTGTVYGNYLNYSEMKSADEVYDISVSELKEKFDLLMLDPLGFNNTYCIAVTAETAQQYNLKTFSDLAAVSSNFVFGGGFEILNRNDGIPNLKKVYNLTFKEERAVEGVLRYTAISSGETQVTEAFSTDGMLTEYDLVVLEDDKSFFPPYHAAPIIRQDTYDKYPELKGILSKLTGVLTDDVMRDLNYRVDVLKEKPDQVSRDFLSSQGLI